MKFPILAAAAAALLAVGCVSESDENAAAKKPAAKPASKSAPKSQPKSQPAPAAKTEKPAAGDAATTGKPADGDAGKDAGKTEQPADGAAISAKDLKAAQNQMKTFCATCHGTDGKGTGPAALALNPKPRNWTDVTWQESVTDEKLFNVIKDGGAKHGLSPLMAANVEFQDRPGVIRALVKLVRKFKGK